MNSRDISELARSRNLRTRELWPFNAYYGHADVLRAYAGIPGREPLKTAIEHGIIPFVRSDPDLATWLPRYFCASPAQACFFEEHALHGARPVATGPLILYATALAPPPPATKRRLVYFDAHSTRYVSASYDVDSAIARLTALRDGFDEVVVCLYWRDVQRGRAELYLRRGFRCVTAGHIFDPRFLFRLAEIIASASVVLTDNLGSHLLYALALERPVWFDFSRAAYEV
ncbi:MAG: hypothetical protein ACRDLK_04585, partial [Gaiellaceae bacterium]